MSPDSCVRTRETRIGGNPSGTGDLYEELVHHVALHRESLALLRREFGRCSEELSGAIATTFNKYRGVGEFEAPTIDAELLRRSFEKGSEPNDRFDEEIFDRFSGPAEGAYLEYDAATCKQVSATTVYSFWGKTRQSRGRCVQKITGSQTTYVDPERVTDISEVDADVTVNVFQPGLGIISIAFTSQPARSEVPAIGYQIGRDQLIWINQEMRRHLEPARENVYLVSLEWADVLEGKRSFLMVALRFEIDFLERSAHPAGSTLWKLRYEQRDLKGLKLKEGVHSSAGGDGGFLPSKPPSATSPASLPDLNAETYPFAMVQSLLDEAAYFNMFSSPEPRSCVKTPISGGSLGGIIGFNLREDLRRFQINISSGGASRFKVMDLVGERLGSSQSRWMLAPGDFPEMPGREPPPTLLDVSRPQRFVMLDTRWELGSRDDGFCGFGTGSTFPVMINGSPQLLVAAVGSTTEGRGKLEGSVGTYTYCGSISPESGFTGNVILRVLDPDARLRTDSTVPDIEECLCREPGVWYLLFRGQKAGSTQKTTYTFGLNGQPNGFRLEQQLRAVYLESTGHGHRGLRASQRVGQVIGSMTSHVFLNLSHPGAAGTPFAPIVFQSRNDFTLTDSDGQVLGTFVAEGGEGKSYSTALAGPGRLSALRFGAFQRITAATGIFGGLEGLLTDNSIASLSPHVTSTLYLVRFCDPVGKLPATVTTRSSGTYSVRLWDEEGQSLKGFARKCRDQD